MTPTTATQQPEPSDEPQRRMLVAFGPVKAKDLLTELARASEQAELGARYLDDRLLLAMRRASLSPSMRKGRFLLS